jgi:hypothetical protein
MNMPRLTAHALALAFLVFLATGCASRPDRGAQDIPAGSSAIADAAKSTSNYEIVVSDLKARLAAQKKGLHSGQQTEPDPQVGPTALHDMPEGLVFCVE